MMILEQFLWCCRCTLASSWVALRISHHTRVVADLLTQLFVLSQRSACGLSVYSLTIAIITQPKADTHGIVPRRVEGWDDLPAHTRPPIQLPSPTWNVNVDLDQRITNRFSSYRVVNVGCACYMQWNSLVVLTRVWYQSSKVEFRAR